MTQYRVSSELRRLPEESPGSLSFSAFTGARHHFAELERAVDARATLAQMEYSQRLNYHIRGFFWELMAAFDLMLMWANDHFCLGLSERGVSCYSVLKATAGCHASGWDRVRTLFQEASDSAWMFEVRQYRHFSHRSFIPVHALVSEGKRDIILLPRAREGQEYVPTLPGAFNTYVNHMGALGKAVFKGIAPLAPPAA